MAIKHIVLSGFRKKAIVYGVVLVVLVSSAIGIALLKSSYQAATSLEVEDGAATSDGVTIKEDDSASGGKYIQFDPIE